MNTVACLPADITVTHLVSRAASARPRHAALFTAEKAPLAFETLERQVIAIGDRLMSFGARPNDRIAVVLPNGVEMAVAALAVSSCATFAPLNPAFGLKEFAFYLEDLKARAVLVLHGSESCARAAARTLNIPVIELLSANPGIQELQSDMPIGSQHRPPTASGPDDVALVLHTSGTTARPKLVPLTHRNLVASAHNIARTLQLAPADRCLNVLPLFHIHGLVAALLAPLSAGSSIVCTPGFRQEEFLGWIDELDPTWYTAVPTLHQSVLKQARATGWAPRRPLRLIRSSSAALPPQVLAELEAVFRCPVIEAYGMTEAAHQMASNPLPPAQRKPGSVGVAAGPEIAILGENGPATTPDVRGEIVIRGPNVTRGYADNPEANRTAFVDGWFRTGDEGYFDDDGYLYISGRLKEMINRGGEKVSPREIDETLLDHPEIAQAVAFAVPHPSLGEDVAAAVVLRDGSSLTEYAIRQFLFERLAGFKIPSQIVLVDDIPKGATGKIQRLRLAELLGSRMKPPYVAPANAVETVVASIFAAVLGTRDVGTADNFFSLGGDSLRGTQVMTRVQAIFAIELPMVALFHKPTPAELSAEILDVIGPEGLARFQETLGQVLRESDQSGLESLAAAPGIPRLPRRPQA